MARKKPEEHFMKFYFVRWLMSETVQAMSFAARGVYWELLVRQYASNTGDLPEDPAILRRMVGADLKEWRAFEPYLNALFPIESHRRRNYFMSEVIAKNQARLESIKSASLQGVQVRQGVPDGTPHGAPHGQPYGNPNGNPDGAPNGQPKRKEKNNINTNYNLVGNAGAGNNSNAEPGKAIAKKRVSTTGTGVFWPDGREKTLEEIRLAHR
ncbi:MAG: DUF1376 domain-containing protein [Desulfurellales bacterium]|nr:MAG: DUF1376 domain-containing protein [Desulfurellales bacterium]